MTFAQTAGLRILVVDDEPAMVGAITALVGTAGHQVITAYDGEAALRRFEEEAPDLVLLDLAMPGRDGVDVCREIRRTSQTPVIVLTGEADELGEGGGARRGRGRLRHEAVRQAGASRADPRGHAAPRGGRGARGRAARGPAGRSTRGATRHPSRAPRWPSRARSSPSCRRWSPPAAASVPHGPPPSRRVGRATRTRIRMWLKPHLARLRAKLEESGAPLPHERSRRRLPPGGDRRSRRPPAGTRPPRAAPARPEAKQAPGCAAPDAYPADDRLHQPEGGADARPVREQRRGEAASFGRVR